MFAFCEKRKESQTNWHPSILGRSFLAPDHSLLASSLCKRSCSHRVSLVPPRRRHRLDRAHFTFKRSNGGIHPGQAKSPNQTKPAWRGTHRISHKKYRDGATIRGPLFVVQMSTTGGIRLPSFWNGLVALSKRDTYSAIAAITVISRRNTGSSVSRRIPSWCDLCHVFGLSQSILRNQRKGRLFTLEVLPVRRSKCS